MNVEEALGYYIKGKVFRQLAPEDGEYQEAGHTLAYEVERLQREAKEHDALMSLQHTRTVEADKLWREANHGKAMTSPDLGVLIDWLLDWLLDRADKAEIETTRIQKFNENCCGHCECEPSCKTRVVLDLEKKVAELTGKSVVSLFGIKMEVVIDSNVPADTIRLVSNPVYKGIEATVIREFVKKLNEERLIPREAGCGTFDLGTHIQCELTYGHKGSHTGSRTDPEGAKRVTWANEPVSGPPDPPRPLPGRKHG